MGKKPIESIVADTILQKGKPVVVGGETFQVAPPTTATLILVSEEIAMLPHLDKTNEDADILKWTLKNAKDCSFLGNIAAILILGADGITVKKHIEQKRFLGLIKTRKEITINRQEELSNLLLRNKSAKELHELIAELISSMEISDFFAITTFLNEINLMKPTREVEMIASGQ